MKDGLFPISFDQKVRASGHVFGLIILLMDVVVNVQRETADTIRYVLCVGERDMEHFKHFLVLYLID